MEEEQSDDAEKMLTCPLKVQLSVAVLDSRKQLI